MILILSEPTEKDLELVKKIMGDKTIEVLDLAQYPEKTKIEKPNVADWLSPEQFITAMKDKGYSCKNSITRKNLCDSWGVTYEMRGRTLYFRNELSKIPSRI